MVAFINTKHILYPLVLLSKAHFVLVFTQKYFILGPQSTIYYRPILCFQGVANIVVLNK